MKITPKVKLLESTVAHILRCALRLVYTRGPVLPHAQASCFHTCVGSELTRVWAGQRVPLRVHKYTGTPPFSGCVTIPTQLDLKGFNRTSKTGIRQINLL